MNKSVLEVIIFNVGQAQSIFFYPRNNPEYGMMVDCAETVSFKPIDFLLNKGFIYFNSFNKRYELGNLAITNYDEDHFSGLPLLRQKVHIKTTHLSNNLSSQLLKQTKPMITTALSHLCHIKDTYTGLATDHRPPYSLHKFSLTPFDFMPYDWGTNNLSQLLFIEFFDSKICIGGDLTRKAWDKLLQIPFVRYHLRTTKIFIAAHHGHEDGYHEDIFSYCTDPECIIISDKDSTYDTQDGMVNKYSSHVKSGVPFNGDTKNFRKVLTTRHDDHIWINIDNFGNRIYRSFSI